ncbi:glycosyltransferase family 2 protein [Glycomyces harbinensis]|uniref:Glycosyl transferase family 2 n=1 Tax=Glycomyces harbinensis TaxID=58114 RepID=A0A1G7CNT0_9ACTN|nr:glycosyltransferase [Glycomyces harbinensis]SDE40992.1 Glycosyl transferase family 2 [Glycomyces harbinensis]
MISDPPFSPRLRALLQDDPSFVGVIGFEDGAAAFAPLLPDDVAAVELQRLPERASAAVTQSPFTHLGAAIIVARTLTDLAEAAIYGEFLPTGRHLYIEVVHMAEPSRPTSIALPQTRPWRTLTEQRIRRSKTGQWSVEVVLDQAVDLASLLRGSIAHRSPRSRPRAPRIGLAGRAAVAWGAGTAAYAIAPTAADGTAPADAYPEADLVLHSLPAETVPTWDGHARLVDRRPAAPARTGGLFPDWREPVHGAPGPQHLPPVNEYLVNPIGFRWDTPPDDPVMSYDNRSWRLYPTDADAFSMPASGTVTDLEVERCRAFRSVAIDWDSHPGTTAGAAAIAGLAAAGVPLVSHGRSPGWARALGDDLLAHIDRYRPRDLHDPLLRELHSVRLRRTAMSLHGSARRRRDGGLAADPDDTVSVILCTRRPTFLSAVFAQIAAQRHDRLELVLVLHGIAAEHPQVKAAVTEASLPMRIVEVPAEAAFGTALNAGVRAASGKYVTKFDDDDWYGPHHVPDLLLAAHYSGADLVGTQPEFVHLEQLDTTIHKRPGRSERFSVHVSGATMLIRREDLLELGGYRPLRTSEDRGLLQDVQRGGGAVYCTHGLNFLVSRRVQGHTWNAAPTSFLRNNDRQWHRVDLGPAIAADTLEDHLRARKGTVAQR